ncbi:MAG: hypothetical protein IKE33_02445 [Erysipelotrichaceae bacterium]|jgi:hypothetical protein|nr:hypothetical protein [Erysipelotrichaceae bacterium]
MIWLYILLGVLILAGAFMLAAPKIFFNSVTTKLTKMYINRDFDAYYKYLDSPWVTYVVSRFDRENFRLNGFRAQNRAKEVDQQYNLLFEIAGSKKDLQRDAYYNAFDYYVLIGNKAKAKRCLEMIKSLGEPILTAQAVMTYDIKILKQANYLDKMIPQFEKGGKLNPMLALLIATQYENLNDRKNAAYYKKYAAGEGPEQIAMQKEEEAKKKKNKKK